MEQKLEFKNLAEAAIDAYGLQQTLEMIAEICWEKAEHIRANWQDPVTAKPWVHASQIIMRASANRTIEALSPRICY